MKKRNRFVLSKLKRKIGTRTWSMALFILKSVNKLDFHHQGLGSVSFGASIQ